MIGNLVPVTLTQLEVLRQDPNEVPNFIESCHGRGSESPVLDIDKSWHLIHFLLTGDTWGGDTPLSDAVLGGVDLGDVDVGYGPARFLTVEEVRNVAAALGEISGDTLWAHFDAKRDADAEIYGSEWRDDDRDYILPHYEKMREQFQKASVAGNAMLLFVN